MEPKGTKRESEEAKREPRGSQEEAKREPKGAAADTYLCAGPRGLAKMEPKGTRRESEEATKGAKRRQNHRRPARDTGGISHSEY